MKTFLIIILVMGFVYGGIYRVYQMSEKDWKNHNKKKKKK